MSRRGFSTECNRCDFDSDANLFQFIDGGMSLEPNVVVEFEALYQFQEIHAANYSRRVL
jgi:hypothetical protein